MGQRQFSAMDLPRSEVDSVCSVQRAGLESGHVWGVNDPPDTGSGGSGRAESSYEERTAHDEPAMGEPMNDAKPMIDADPSW